MLKKWFTLPSEEEMAPPAMPSRSNGSAGHPHATAAPAEPNAPVEPPAAVPTQAVPASRFGTFEQVYQNAAIKPPRLPYNILKVAEMVSSSHLATMSPEAKRCSLLMALEAAGAAVEDVLQDAVIRQRALADYEEAQRTRVKNFENSKAEENNKIQAELDRLTTLHMSRIQANLDEVAREQDNFRSWQKAKNHESQRITEAAAFCVPQGSPISATSLAGVLERATVTH